jgi:muramoyltetrapeptide carboxypeptidase
VGDTVALCAVSGVVSETTIERATSNLTSIGLNLKWMPNARKRWGGYAGTIEERVADLHAAFVDREVSAIWCARGGSGAQALLPQLDYALIARHPKVLIGYSDVTALTNALWARAGVVSFHGPVSSSQFTPFNVANLQRVLFDAQSNAAAWPEGWPALQAMNDAAKASPIAGTLVGGNLSVFASLVGTPYLPDTRDALIFLEDVSEAPYRIDRMLTQLAQAGVFARCAGVILGAFTRTEPKDNEPTLSVQEVFVHHFARAPFPVVMNAPFGHIPTQWVLPVGVRAALSLQNASLTFLEPAVL